MAGDWTLGIDGSNLRAGGGLTHLIQLLEAASPGEFGFSKVIVWAGSQTIAALPKLPWLAAIEVGALDGPVLQRAYWQFASLPRVVKDMKVDLLFSPGGNLPIRPGVPAVTMFRNMLPFSSREARRYLPDLRFYLRLMMLRRSQLRSFRNANGVIFLTDHARQVITDQFYTSTKLSAVVPHGLSRRFFIAPESNICDSPGAFRVLYVSIIDVYKHQREVAEAASILRDQGVPIEVEFIGPAYGPAMEKFDKTLSSLDPGRNFLRYIGPLPFTELHLKYRAANAFVFASSCENLPNILLEAMAAGLPIACSNIRPMSDILGDAGLYFNPEAPTDIAQALFSLYKDADVRRDLGQRAHRRALAYSWETCARATFAFLKSVVLEATACGPF